MTRNICTVQTTLFTAITAANVFAGASVHAETAQDIIGIKTGMTPDQVRPILEFDVTEYWLPEPCCRRNRLLPTGHWQRCAVQSDNGWAVME